MLLLPSRHVALCGMCGSEPALKSNNGAIPIHCVLQSYLDHRIDENTLSHGIHAQMTTYTVRGQLYLRGRPIMAIVDTCPPKVRRCYGMTDVSGLHKLS